MTFVWWSRTASRRGENLTTLLSIVGDSEGFAGHISQSEWLAQAIRGKGEE